MKYILSVLIMLCSFMCFAAGPPASTDKTLKVNQDIIMALECHPAANGYWTFEISKGLKQISKSIKDVDTEKHPKGQYKLMFMRWRAMFPGKQTVIATYTGTDDTQLPSKFTINIDVAQ